VAKAKVLPSSLLYKGLEQKLAQGDLDPTQVVRMGARYLIQCAVEFEVKEHLGRDYFQHGFSRDASGRRSGYIERQIQTGEGRLEVKLPQVRDTKVAFRSKIIEAYVARMASLEDLISRMYVHGLSTCDIETVMQEFLQGRGIYRSVVSQLTERLGEDFERFRKRPLGDGKYWYLFLDGTFVRYRLEGDRKEPILAACGIREDGKMALLGLAPASRESTSAWNGFLNDMRGRGFKDPLLVVSDGNPVVVAAIEEIWPQSLRLRCQKHHMENILDRVPDGYRVEVKAAIHKAYYHEGTFEEALQIAKEVEKKYERRFPEAMKIFGQDFEPTLTVLKLPKKHWRIARTTNLLERLFGDNRRRTKVIPHFFHESAAMKLIYAVLVTASKKWRGIEMTTSLYAELASLREERMPRDEKKLSVSA